MTTPVTTPEDVGVFVEHVITMRNMINKLPKEEIEVALYGYVEACRFMYGEKSLLFKWIEAEYYSHVEF